MATVQLGPIVSAISGCIGGVEFRQSGGVTVAQSRPVVRQVLSKPQEAEQIDFARVLDSWDVVTAGNKQAWQQFAIWWNKNVRVAGAGDRTAKELAVAYSLDMRWAMGTLWTVGRPPVQKVTSALEPVTWHVGHTFPWSFDVSSSAGSQLYRMTACVKVTTYTGKSRDAGRWFRAGSAVATTGSPYNYVFSNGLQPVLDGMRFPAKIRVRIYWQGKDPDPGHAGLFVYRWRSLTLERDVTIA